MITNAANKNINKVLYELDKIFFKTNNSYSEAEAIERGTTYTELVGQFRALNKQQYIHEIYYRVLVGENINNVFVELINRDNEIYFILYPYIYTLEEFFDFDEIKMFV